jgi:integrase
MRESVVLTKICRKKPNGQKYAYWVLRWFDTNGKWRSKSLGRVGKISKRMAEKLRRKRQSELDEHPGRRNVTQAPKLGEFLNTYLCVRESELAPGTLELHRQTGRYLLGYFGANRRLNSIQRAHVRAFKAALAAEKLSSVQKKKRKLSEATVAMHIRNARKIFGTAVDDDLIPFNPFDRIAGSVTPPKAWHEVTDAEFAKLMDRANSAWRLLLALTRYAGLRRGEALNLRWDQIDWERSRLTIIANDEWRPKDRDSRVVPIVPGLHAMLLEAFDRADPGAEKVIPDGLVKVKNISRDFTVLCKRAGVQRYAKPFHTLRKTCLTAWARDHAQHVVQEWAGHASAVTTGEYYLQVSEAEYEKAAGKTSSEQVVARLVARLADFQPSPPQKPRGTNSQVHASKAVTD